MTTPPGFTPFQMEQLQQLIEQQLRTGNNLTRAENVAALSAAIAAQIGPRLSRLLHQTAAVRRLCAEHQTEGGDGDMTDVDTLWPSQVLDVLDAPPDVTR